VIDYSELKRSAGNRNFWGGGFGTSALKDTRSKCFNRYTSTLIF